MGPGARAPERAPAAAHWTLGTCSVILVGMKDANTAETELQRAMREACEQDAERDAENAQVEAQAVQAPRVRENPSLLLSLRLEYTPEGRLVSADGYVNTRTVLHVSVPFGTEAPDVGELANETLRLGALGALLG